jgi:phosphoglycolate phosphatase-like HAD superfamily hydrolase
MSLEQLVAHATVILLDFDGPVCSIFAGLPAPEVADRMRTHLRDLGWPESDLPSASDPLAVLTEVAQRRPEHTASADTVLRTAEIEAASTARPTDGIGDLLAACDQSGRMVAIVSNNSYAAIQAFLKHESRSRYVAHIEGRDPDPALMKPNPHVLRKALNALRVATSESVFLGDSVSDASAAQAANVPFIGYANKPGKRAALEASGADAVIDSLTDVTRVVALTISDGPGPRPHR